METVLVTGGLGYIGSHTVTQLNNYKVVIIDNLRNSQLKTHAILEKITGRKIHFHYIDMCNLNSFAQLFKMYKFDHVIHFAALKSVPESIQNPLDYFYNNITSTINLLTLMERYNVKNLIFSSSCSVYGNTSNVVTETTPFGIPLSPYAHTKQICEQIITSCQKNIHSIIILRYFNPVGVHDSFLLGEDKSSISLVPVIVRNENVKIFGCDYDTIDGTPLRDYVHIMDIVQGHICALKKINCITGIEIYNLGSGVGSTVLEVIQSFERVSGQKVSYEIMPRRNGDVAKIFADNQLARKNLNWCPHFSLDQMILSYWNYYNF